MPILRLINGGGNAGYNPQNKFLYVNGAQWLGPSDTTGTYAHYYAYWNVPGTLATDTRYRAQENRKKIIPLDTYAPRYAQAGQPVTPFSAPDATDNVFGQVKLG